MPEIEIGIDFDSAEKASGPMPDGDYDVQLVDANLGETGPNSKVPGTPKIDWMFEVINHSNPDYNGRKLFMTTVISTNGAGTLVSLTKALGTPWKGTKLDTDIYLGAHCKAKVITEEYNGNFQNKIKKVY